MGRRAVNPAVIMSMMTIMAIMSVRRIWTKMRWRHFLEINVLNVHTTRQMMSTVLSGNKCDMQERPQLTVAGLFLQGGGR
ncbi:hypothetical protein CLOSYM_02189 [[Clostridium] symbiosum ATCC 14940]|uniref:Secreted protein n=1 Tax=[Clostridium] symbiosum ATCC 14940 TaxID=411472 RepID=A0ABC9TYA5_CLOSY|nr:hypothetical protein CLOSYM_02189 [[Clostridium] symbiosum ATCC 14940]